MSSTTWRVLGTGSAVVAGIAAGKVVDLIWRKAGQDTDIDPRNPEVPIAQAIGYAALTGLAAGIAKTLMTRKAAAYYQHSSGHLPEPLMPKHDTKS